MHMGRVPSHAGEDMRLLLLPFRPRYALFSIALAGTLVLAWLAWRMPDQLPILAIPLALSGGLAILGLHDFFQSRHAILRNYPIAAHLRFLLEKIRPEMRQYFFEDDKDGMPFPRDKRAIVYQRAKGVLDKRPFGTQYDVYQSHYEWLHHSMAPKEAARGAIPHPIGGLRCTQPYSASVFNISAMSYGSLSANAVRALNKGAKLGGFAHDTGEGGFSPYHREHGGDIIWEIGSGYFGCRNADGTFAPEKFAEVAASPQIKMVELKLSQGAKPGHGGVLPGAKVTREIARIRGVPSGTGLHLAGLAFGVLDAHRDDAIHRRDASARPAASRPASSCASGIPGSSWPSSRRCMETGITPDFIVVDGTEGGTGAAPLEFMDHLGMPLRDGLTFVHSALVGAGLRERIKLGASGKITSGFDMARVMALGADWCNAARGFMFAVGCIQAQQCHTGHCPTGVTSPGPLAPARHRRVRQVGARGQLPSRDGQGAGRARCGRRARASARAAPASLHAPGVGRADRHIQRAVSVSQARRASRRHRRRPLPGRMGVGTSRQLRTRDPSRARRNSASRGVDKLGLPAAGATTGNPVHDGLAASV